MFGKIYYKVGSVKIKTRIDGFTLFSKFIKKGFSWFYPSSFIIILRMFEYLLNYELRPI